MHRARSLALCGILVLLSRTVYGQGGLGGDWGDASFSALCWAGRPSAECPDRAAPGSAAPHAPPPPLPATAKKSTSKTAQYSIAVPGHQEVVAWPMLKVTVHASGAPLPSSSVFQILVVGRSRSGAEGGGGPWWEDNKSWRLLDMGEEQKPGPHAESFSYVFVFDVSPAADGPVQVSLMFHPGDSADAGGRGAEIIRGGYPGREAHVMGEGGGEFQGWVLVDSVEVILSLGAQGADVGAGGGVEGAAALAVGAGGEGADDEDVGCARGVGLRACRGCTVLAVEAGLVRYECGGEEGGAGAAGRDMLLEDDQRRSARFSAAARLAGALPASYALVHRSGGGGELWPGEEGDGVGAGMVTVTVTSCGREELLVHTMESFFAANDYEDVHEVLIIEDSGLADMCERLRQRYVGVRGGGGAGTPRVRVLCNAQRLGQMKSLDRVWAHVTTPWIFHLEDDWVFDGSPGFMQASLAILRENPLCFQVHLRHRASAIHPVHWTLLTTQDQVSYRRLVWDWGSDGHQSWQGFSTGPGMRRRQLVEALGPMEAYGSELRAQAAFASRGLWAAALEVGVVEHAGDDVSKRFEWEAAL